MTGRDFLRDLERDLEDLEETHGTSSFADWWRAWLKTVDDQPLTAEEELLLENPARHLSASGKRNLRDCEAWVTDEVLDG